MIKGRVRLLSLLNHTEQVEFPPGEAQIHPAKNTAKNN
jgi:hypothetical protein